MTDEVLSNVIGAFERQIEGHQAYTERQMAALREQLVAERRQHQATLRQCCRWKEMVRAGTARLMSTAAHAEWGRESRAALEKDEEEDNR